MNSVFSRLASITFLILLLAGCASDKYFMVEKKDLDSISESIDQQTQQIQSLEGQTWAQLETITQLNTRSTQSILSAISEQVAKSSCPPVTAQPSCKASTSSSNDQHRSSQKGHADRLKGKVIVGELEKFYLVDPGLVHVARIDSGAETSSLDARNITRFERDGNNWVRFDIPKPDSDEFITLEREISRRVKIIQSSADEAERRVVVELQFMIGDHRQQAEFTLTNREHLSHTVLVGRNILRDVMLIDVGKEYATELPSTLPNRDSGDQP